MPGLGENQHRVFVRAPSVRWAVPDRVHGAFGAVHRISGERVQRSPQQCFQRNQCSNVQHSNGITSATAAACVLERHCRVSLCVLLTVLGAARHVACVGLGRHRAIVASLSCTLQRIPASGTAARSFWQLFAALGTSAHLAASQREKRRVPHYTVPASLLLPHIFTHGPCRPLLECCCAVCFVIMAPYL